MSGKVWLGQIFIRDEGGFELIMRALNHYNRRLRRISDSPELAGAGAALGSVLQSESARVAPRLKSIANRLRAGLTDPSELAALERDIEIIEKAMVCYRSDSQRAADGLHGYYAALVEGNEHYRRDMSVLDSSVERLKRYG